MNLIKNSKLYLKLDVEIKRKKAIQTSNILLKTINNEIEAYTNLYVLIDPDAKVLRKLLKDAIHFNISQRDITIGFKTLIRQSELDSKNFSARILAMLLYEFIKDLKEMMSGNFRKDLIKIISLSMLLEFDRFRTGLTTKKWTQG